MPEPSGSATYAPTGDGERRICTHVWNTQPEAWASACSHWPPLRRDSGPGSFFWGGSWLES